MDKLLCDELVQEIFLRLPPPSSSSVSLVSKRWLHLLRTSRTSLTLRLTGDDSTVASLSSLLSHYPFLSCLSILLSDPRAKTTLADQLLLLVCTFCAQLLSLRFLAGPVSVSSLNSLSTACTQLTSLCISLSRPLFLTWVISFPKLKELSIMVCSGEIGVERGSDYGVFAGEDTDAELGVESLCLSGIGAGDGGLGWLWRSCRKLKKLQLKSCEGVGDGGSFSSFIMCLQGVQEVELRTCRSILDGVLLKMAENCDSLTSLLVYDGGSREGLLRFFSQCRCNLQKLDFRLPLDLKNDHLLAVATNYRSLSSIRLQSCCLVSGEGLKALGAAVSSRLEELALINCDVVEREPGLLSTLGQNLRKLRKLDLSYNELLLDKEFMSMLVSCNYLVDLRVRGCKRLTNASIISMFKSCKCLESVDIMHCGGIQAEAVESFVLNSPQLRRVQVEQSKISDVAKTWASHKFIEAVA
ncbi:putative F-box domain, leucine-rich repeat domain, L domain-containing protein [Rosa chinensis]|uniref:Putative F-box domain, leucine-rich repeat domain, L domain-containing protein n=1 Tax=Rosa chinensis TaxID=74649 RepID=A0A2P6S5P9_ROSCH|nr:F-box/LRR-repeat protein 4 [Rosa chinensis]PRQ54007.1 putative F-box domain, leucine-rich repeat domain, L domain-containing protein [Rosa chinensis]